MPEKKERAAKYYVSTKDQRDPLVLLAENEKDAVVRWTKRTGRKASEAVATKIGTLAETITRQTVNNRSISAAQKGLKS
jgi:hypothetical protein